MLLLLYDKWNHLFTNMDHHQQHWLTEEKMEEACAAIHDKGSPLPNLWGFINGTIWWICHPETGQRLVYNGHKSVHYFKYQSVVTPFGIVVHLYGPVDGKSPMQACCVKVVSWLIYSRTCSIFQVVCTAFMVTLLVGSFSGCHNYYWRGSV